MQREHINKLDKKVKPMTIKEVDELLNITRFIEYSGTEDNIYDLKSRLRALSYESIEQFINTEIFENLFAKYFEGDLKTGQDLYDQVFENPFGSYFCMSKKGYALIVWLIGKFPYIHYSKGKYPISAAAVECPCGRMHEIVKNGKRVELKCESLDVMALASNRTKLIDRFYSAILFRLVNRIYQLPREGQDETQYKIKFPHCRKYM